MAVIWEGAYPWPLIAGVIFAILAQFLIFKGVRARWRSLGRHWLTRVAVLAFSLTAAFLLTLAIRNPVSFEPPVEGGVHLSVVLDISASVARDNPLPEIAETAARALALDLIPSVKRDRSRASIVLMGESPALFADDLPLRELPEALRRVTENDLPPADGSDLAGSLRVAGKQAAKASAGGAVLLVSDGNQNRGDAVAAAQDLARRGIAALVLEIGSDTPDLGLVAADLPPTMEAGAQTILRAVAGNSRDRDLNADVRLSRNKGLPAEHPAGSTASKPISVALPASARQGLRWPLAFQGFGLQYVDISLAPESGSGQTRRFFTFVRRPPRFLSVGGDHAWAEAFGLKEAEIVEVAPENLPGPAELEDFDAVILSGVHAQRFRDGALAGLAAAVSRNGVGLMLLNGAHGGASDETPTALMSYDHTAVGPLLPLSGQPRRKEDKPPPRQLVIMIDVSGSMNGWPLAQAKAIASHIVKTQLRDEDRLFFITFSGGARLHVNDRKMDYQGKQEALGKINGLAAGGGTDPTDALALIAGKNLRECGLIIISDGEFGDISNRLARRPECLASGLVTRSGALPGQSGLRNLAEIQLMGPATDPRSIVFKALKTEPRDKFFERGVYQPALTDGRDVRAADRLPMPELDLYGSAVSFLKEDATLIAARPGLSDPVLAYRQAGQGYAGVFTSAFPSAWRQSREGRQAIQAWINRVSPLTARDRYDIRVQDRGDYMEARIALGAESVPLPSVHHIEARLAWDDREMTIPLRPDPFSPAVFRGVFRPPRGESARSARLILAESGRDALSRSQRIPFLIPPQGALESDNSDEAYSYGVNVELLKRIAEITGGRATDAAGAYFQASPASGPKTPLWPYVAIGAFLLYLLAIVIRRLLP